MGRRGMVSDAQKRADAKYKRERTRLLAVRFYPKDAELWAHIEAQPSKAEYIKGLVRRDMSG